MIGQIGRATGHVLVALGRVIGMLELAWARAARADCGVVVC